VAMLQIPLRHLMVGSGKLMQNLATGLAHEKAIRTFLYRLTNHGYHILSIWIF